MAFFDFTEYGKAGVSNSCNWMFSQYLSALFRIVATLCALGVKNVSHVQKNRLVVYPPLPVSNE